MIARAMSQVGRLRPRVLDPRTIALVAVAFGIGVLTVAWHGKSFRFDVEGANLGWVILVAFGMTWHGEWRQGWRVGAGLVVGAGASVAALYGAMSILPVTPFSVGLGLGFTASCIAVIAHIVPRAMSFAGAAVGFGVGIAGARALPVRPTTPADDVFTLVLTIALALAIGVFGSLALRALVIRMGDRPHGSLFVRFTPRDRVHDDRDVTTEIARPVAAERRQKAGMGR